MKKLTFAFAAGQALQLLILFVGQSLTYAANLFLFCVILGAAATLMLLLGSVLTALETVEDIDEAPELPKGIKVSNDKVERVEELHKAVEAAQRRTARAVEEVR